MLSKILIGMGIAFICTAFICMLMPDTNTPEEDERQYKWCQEHARKHKKTKKENGYIS